MRDLAAVLVLTVGPVAGAEPRGMLPADGDPALAAEIDRGLAEAISSKRLSGVLLPVLLQARLAGAAGVGRALDEARALVEQGEAAVVNMQREQAIGQLRRAIVKLDEVCARHHARKLLARAHGSLALALLLRPADEDGAYQALAAAVAVDQSYDPGIEELPPEAANLLDRARGRRIVNAPTPEQLALLAYHGAVDEIFWIGVRRPADAEAELEVLLYSASGRAVRAHIHRKVPASQAAAQALALVSQMSKGQQLVAGAPSSAPASAPAPATASQRGPRWYRRWWVWAIAGAVVAGSVAVIVATTRGARQDRPPEGFDLEFTWP